MRIVLTMLRPDALAERLEADGHEIVRAPLVAVEPLGDEPVDVSGYDWVVLTSVNGARELRRRLRGEPARVAAIGAATAEAWGQVDLVPVVATQEGLLAELPRPAGRVLFAGAEGARRLLVDELGADFVALYRTLELEPEEPPDGDLVVLASPSAARAYARAGGGAAAVAIGPETARAARAAGLVVAAEAETQDGEGLAAAVAAAAR
ncbi:MAG TPA: uroporphyrinogen-III synthase [Gaiellaceae bacterium]|nr:uroporphyrinogen-III synthase [Gaiellaceae bacterium]